MSDAGSVMSACSERWSNVVQNLFMERLEKRRGSMSDVDKLYRIMQHTIVDIFFEACGRLESHKWIRSAGFSAGVRFAEEFLDMSDKLFIYIGQLQRILNELNIGTLKIKRAGSGKMEFILDCSRHATYAYTMCCYGEGLLSGMLETYINKKRKSNLSGYEIQLSV